MKISISPLDTNQSSICNFEICKKQGNLASCSEVTLEYQLDIELTKCECLFGSNSEYKLELNIPNEKFTNCFHINYDQIKNLNFFHFGDKGGFRPLVVLLCNLRIQCFAVGKPRHNSQFHHPQFLSGLLQFPSNHIPRHLVFPEHF